MLCLTEGVECPSTHSQCARMQLCTGVAEPHNSRSVPGLHSMQSKHGVTEADALPGLKFSRS